MDESGRRRQARKVRRETDGWMPERRGLIFSAAPKQMSSSRYKTLHAIRGAGRPKRIGSSALEGGGVEDVAEFLRQKAAQCRTLAEEASASEPAQRGLLALALELDAQAVAVEAGRATAREIDAATAPENQSGSH
jgi:hypothetical protein